MVEKAEVEEEAVVGPATAEKVGLVELVVLVDQMEVVVGVEAVVEVESFLMAVGAVLIPFLCRHRLHPERSAYLVITL